MFNNRVITKETLEDLLHKQALSLNKAAEKLGISLTNIRYWATKHQVKSKYGFIGSEDPTKLHWILQEKNIIIMNNKFICKNCGTNDKNKFTTDRPRMCVDCRKAYLRKKADENWQTIKGTGFHKQKRKDTKLRLLEAIGQTSCKKCGYSKCHKALEFHHKDQNTKIFPLAQIATRKFATSLKEAQKCDVLCSNCHREYHDQTELYEIWLKI